MYPFIIIFTWLVPCIQDTTSIYGLNLLYLNVLSMLGNSMPCSQGLITSVYFFYINPEVILSWYLFLVKRMNFDSISKQQQNFRSNKVLPFVQIIKINDGVGFNQENNLENQRGLGGESRKALALSKNSSDLPIDIMSVNNISMLMSSIFNNKVMPQDPDKQPS